MPRKKKADRVAVTSKIAQRAAKELRRQRELKRARIPGDASEAAVLLGKRRAALMTEEEWKEHCRKAGKTYWNSMTPRQRQLEIRRRVAVRRKNRQARLREKLGKGES